MQMQQTLPLPKLNLLRRTLLGNAAFSTLCSLVLLIWSKPMATLLGISEPFVLVVLGIGILLFAPALAWIAMRPQLDRKIATIIFLLDAAWVVISIILLLTDWVAFSASGKWVVICVTDVVAFFAVLEYLGLRQLRTER